MELPNFSLWSYLIDKCWLLFKEEKKCILYSIKTRENSETRYKFELEIYIQQSFPRLQLPGYCPGFHFPGKLHQWWEFQRPLSPASSSGRQATLSHGENLGRFTYSRGSHHFLWKSYSSRKAMILAGMGFQERFCVKQTSLSLPTENVNNQGEGSMGLWNQHISTWAKTSRSIDDSDLTPEKTFSDTSELWRAFFSLTRCGSIYSKGDNWDAEVA